MSDHPRDSADVAGREQLRRAAVLRLHPGRPGSPDLDRLAELARRILKAPSAILALVGAESSVVGRAAVPPDAYESTMPLEESLCALVADAGVSLAVPDTRADPRTARLPSVANGYVGSYLGVPVRSDGDEVVGALCVFGREPRAWTADDVGTLEELAYSASAELELAALIRDYEVSRARWDPALAAAGVGSFDWDLATGRLEWDERLVELFGYDVGEPFPQTIDGFSARLHPEDVPPVTAALERAIATIGPYEAEYRVVLPDGRVRRVQARGLAVGTDGRAQRVFGAAWDVSVTRGAEERAARIVEAMPVGYLAVRPDGSVATVNKLAERMTRRGRSELIDHVLWPLIPDGPGGLLRAAFERVIGTAQPETIEVYVDVVRPVWFEVRLWPEPNGAALYISDITARQAARELAERAAAHDREVAGALQDVLLSPLQLPAGIEAAARYRTAAVDERVGGDWYDSVDRDGLATVVVGDVVGHDITAAATMGQLRSILRAYLWEARDTALPLSAAVRRFDHAALALYPGALATAIVARIERDDAGAWSVLRWTNAGHPPPVLVRADGDIEVLEDGYDLLLGVRPGRERRDFTRRVSAGDTVLLYTDGLVETRAEGIDAGLQRLTDVLRAHVGLPLEQLVDRVLEGALAHTPDTGAPTGDDLVVVALRIGHSAD